MISPKKPFCFRNRRMIFFSSVWVNPTKLLGFRRMANKLLRAEPSSKFLSSTLMIGHPEIICCPKLDHLGKKGAWVVLSVYYARYNCGPWRRRDVVTKARWLSPLALVCNHHTDGTQMAHRWHTDGAQMAVSFQFPFRYAWPC